MPSNVIIKQPDGKYATWSAVSDSFPRTNKINLAAKYLEKHDA